MQLPCINWGHGSEAEERGQGSRRVTMTLKHSQMILTGEDTSDGGN